MAKGTLRATDETSNLLRLAGAVVGILLASIVSESALACTGDLTSCGGICVDLTTSSGNCGGCDAGCSPGLNCIMGVCDQPQPFLAGLRPTTTSIRQVNPPDQGGWITAIVPGTWDPLGNTLMIGTPGGGIFTTTDNGSHWVSNVVSGVYVNANLGPSDPVIYELQLDALSGSTLVFALTPDTFLISSDWSAVKQTPTWHAVGGQSGEPWALSTIPANQVPPSVGVSYPRPMAQMNLPTSLVQPGLTHERVVLWSLANGGINFSTTDKVTGYTHVYPFTGGTTNALNFLQSIATDQEGYIYIASMALDLSSGSPTPAIYRTQWNPGTNSPNTPWQPYTGGLPAVNPSGPLPVEDLSHPLI